MLLLMNFDANISKLNVNAKIDNYIFNVIKKKINKKKTLDAACFFDSRFDFSNDFGRYYYLSSSSCKTK